MDSAINYAVVLAGGSGTRLWPISRRNAPKQLLSLNGQESLLAQTIKRIRIDTPDDKIYTVTLQDQKQELLTELKSVDPRLANGLILEPMARNTLPAVSWAVMKILRLDPEAIIGVFPADHVVADTAAFSSLCKEATKVAAEGYLVTFGIKPTSPETGYGYIQASESIGSGEALKIEAFVEKPDIATATRYLEQGGYYWNSGMFAFKAAVFAEELKLHQPDLFAGILEIVEQNPTDDELAKCYQSLPNLSIDYGIMEKTSHGAIIPADMGWSDLGSWQALYEISDKDSQGNVIKGDVSGIGNKNSLLLSDHGHLAAIGMEDMAIIQTNDAVLVSRRDRVEEVKEIVQRLKAKNSSLVEDPSTVKRPWGTYTVLEQGPGYKIKRIEVTPGQKLSLQKHEQRAEHWVVVAGTAHVTNGDDELDLQANESAYIPCGNKHRLENRGVEPLQIIEVQTGTYLGEDDIVRFEDSYGRVKN